MSKLISDKIRGLALNSLENVDVSSMLRLVSIGYVYNKKNTKNRLKLFLKVTAKFLFDKYKYNINSSFDSIFLFIIPHHNRGRINPIDMITKVAEISKKYDIISSEKRLLYLTPILGLRCLFKCLIWNKQLRSAGLTVYERLFVFDFLIDAYKFKEKYLIKINIHKYKLLTVLFDADPFENYLVQVFKSQEIKTATLQHGIVLASREDEDPNVSYELKGLELQCSVSDYFLAWNEFTRQEALKSGMEDEKIKILGISYFVGHNNDSSLKPVRNRVFGVVLNTKESEDDNIALIRFANALASKIDYKYILRYHPRFSGNEYNNIIDYRYFLLNSPKQSLILDYVKTVEFSLISVSTVYMELIFLNHRTYRFSTNGVGDKYRDIDFEKFNNIEELWNLVNNDDKEGSQNQLFDYLCGTKLVDKKYESFFSNLV